MPKQITMVFWRDNDVGQAHLQYSWVPEGGKRRDILLMPDYQEDSKTCSVSDRISQVQVYRLLCNDVGTDNWYIPPHPPQQSEVTFASIEVFQKSMEVISTVHFDDGSSIRNIRILIKSPPPRQ
jgi:hypothetical protein